MKDFKIAIHSCPQFSRAEEARLQLQAASQALHQMAADAHAEGMYLEGQSARFEMLTEGLDDEDVVRVRDRFVEEGLLEVTAVTNAMGGQA